MTAYHIVYITSLIVTVILSAFIAWYARRNWKGVAGAGTYQWFAVMAGFLALLQSFSLLGPTERWALIWFNLRFIPLSTTPLIWFVFVMRYIGKDRLLSRRVIAVMGVIPLLTQILLWTNDLHGLWLASDVEFIHVGPFFIPDLSTRIAGPGFMVHSIYGFSLPVCGLFILMAAALRMRQEHRRQAVLLGAGTLVMIVGVLLPTINILPGTSMNLVPQSFAIGMIFIAWAIYRHRFLAVSPEVDREKTVPAMLMLVIAVISTGIIAVGFLYYRNYEHQYRAQVEHELDIIAQLKVSDIVQWRNERLADGELLHRNDTFASLIERLDMDKTDADAAWRVGTWLSKLMSTMKYERIMLLDASGNPIMLIPDNSEAVYRFVLEKLHEIKKASAVTFLDFFREGPAGPLRLAVISPIVYDRPGSAILGFAVLVIDPDKYLYPLMSRWPTPSMTAESLLLRREGNSVVYLNELRYRKNTALTLRLPLSMKRLPAAMAVLGQEGVVEGVDYRGVPVLAALRQVPDSPWYLEARINQDEVYAPVRERFWLMSVTVVILLCGMSASVWFVWRRRGERYLIEKLAASEQLREQESQYRLLADHMTDTVWLMDMSLQTTFISPSVVRNRGFTLEELRAMPLARHLTPDSLIVAVKAFGEVMAKLKEDPSFPVKRTLLLELYRKDGSTFWSENTFTVIRDGEGNPTSILGEGRDVTERFEAETALRQSEERLHLAMSAAKAGAWEWDLPTGRNVWSDELWELYGLEPRSCEPSYEAWLGAIHPDDRERAERAVRTAAEKGTEIATEWRVKDYNGAERWLMSRGSPVYNAQGKVVSYIGIVMDITARKYTEQALRESEERYRNTMEHMMEGCQIIGFDWRYLYLNEAAARHGQRPREELMGRTMMEVYPGIETTAMFALLKDCMENRTPHHMENEFAFPDGSSGWFDLGIQPAPEGLFLLSMDITERKHAEAALRASEEKFFKSFQNSADAIAISRLSDGMILEINKTYETQLGYARGEVINHLAGELNVWADLADRGKYVAALRESGKAVNGEFRFRLKSGEIKDFVLSGDTFEMNGEWCIVNILHDITERKRIEEEIRSLNESLEQRVRERTAQLEEAAEAVRANALRIEDLYNHAPCGYHSLDENGMFVEINDTELEWLGYRRDEIVGVKSVTDVVTGESKKAFHEIFPKFKERGFMTNIELEIVRKDGIVLPVLLSATADRDRNGRFVKSRATLVDFSEVKKARDEMARYAARLEESNRELESFSYSVSHDLRAPLRSIDGFSQVILEDYAPLFDDAGRDYLGRLRKATSRMDRLIDDILMLSRLGRTEIRAERVDLGVIARSVMDGIREREPDRDVEFVVADGMTVTGDPALLRIVLENLLANAWKFTAHQDSPRVEFGAEERDGEREFYVRDNGAGFDMKYADRLFTPFQRLHSTEEFPGTGIGLALVRRIITRHGGMVRAVSPAGEGAEIYFTIGKII